MDSFIILKLPRLLNRKHLSRQYICRSKMKEMSTFVLYVGAVMENYGEPSTNKNANFQDNKIYFLTISYFFTKNVSNLEQLKFLNTNRKYASTFLVWLEGDGQIQNFVRKTNMRKNRIGTNIIIHITSILLRRKLRASLYKWSWVWCTNGLFFQIRITKTE